MPKGYIWLLSEQIYDISGSKGLFSGGSRHEEKKNDKLEKVLVEETRVKAQSFCRWLDLSIPTNTLVTFLVPLGNYMHHQNRKL